MSCLRTSCRCSLFRCAAKITAALCSWAILASTVFAQCASCGADGGVCGDGIACADGTERCADGSGGGLLQRCRRCGVGLACCQGDGTHCGMPAPSYPVPFATPANVTHTTLTYPPLMPHHSLPHYAGTYSFRHGPGLSRTNVHWRQPKALNALQFLHHMVEIPR